MPSYRETIHGYRVRGFNGDRENHEYEDRVYEDREYVQRQRDTMRGYLFRGGASDRSKSIQRFSDPRRGYDGGWGAWGQTRETRARDFITPPMNYNMDLEFVIKELLGRTPKQ